MDFPDLATWVCFKPLHRHISLHPNPSLALQAACALESRIRYRFHPIGMGRFIAVT